MDRSILKPDHPQTELVRQRFEVHIANMGLPGLPKPLVRKGPMHYEGPAWLSSMWFGFLLSARTTFTWRDPGFEGDFVKGDNLRDMGLLLMDQDAGSKSTDMRVPAEWVVNVVDWIVQACAQDDQDLKYAQHAKGLLDSREARDKEAKKKK